MVVADTVVSIGVIAAFYSLLALGMNIKYGHTGLLDFGHVAFFLIGAYTAALFTLPPDVPGDFTKYLFGLDMPWVVAGLAGTLLAGIVGAFVALPTLRLREDYLAITVLGVSVILQRIVQAEAWLVNGPDALRGIHQPLNEFFPMGGATVGGAVASFLIAGGIWALATYALGRAVALTDPDERSWRVTFPRRLHSLGTFASDRVLAAEQSDGPGPGGDSATGDESAPNGGTPDGGASVDLGTRAVTVLADLGRDHYVGSALVGGVVVGAVAGLVTLVSTVGLLTWGALVSGYTWLVVGASLNRYVADFTRVDLLVAAGLGTAYMLALAPMYFLRELTLWLPLTVLAFGLAIGATHYLRTRWTRLANNPFRYAALAGLTFVGIWYFVLPILNDLLRWHFLSAATTLSNNLIWVLSFAGPEPIIGYSRFLLFLFGALTVIALFVSDLIVESPFGRVLRAVRNDERVVNSLGKDPFMFKVQSMAIGSALAGLAGVLAAMYYQALVFTMFAPRVTFIALLMMFLGGIGNNRAMVVGAVIFWAFQTATTELAGFVDPSLRTRFQAFRFVVMGVLFLAVLYYRPEGLLGRRSATEVGGGE